MPEWMKILYIYTLSKEIDLRTNNLEVHTDIAADLLIQLRYVRYSNGNQYPLIQEFLDGLQDA